MPFGNWSSHKNCVQDMMENQGYDEETAHEVCQSLEQELEGSKNEDAEEIQELIEEEINSEEGNVKELINSIEEAGSIISDGVLEMVSAVSNPSQPSDWIMMKSEEKEYDWKSTSPLVFKQDEEEDLRLGYAPALVPYVVDKDEDVIPATVIRKMAHDFMKKDGGIDEEHQLIEGKGEVVESWLLKEERTFDMPDGDEKSYPAGTWMLGIEFVKETWEKIKSGDLKGLSIYGKSQHIQLKSNETVKISREEMKSICSSYIEEMKEKGIDYITLDGKGNSVKPLSKESDSKDDTMSEEDINEIKQALEKQAEILEALKENDEDEDEEEEDKEDEDEDEDEDKQEINNLTDAIDYIEENTPEEVSSMIVDAIREEESAEEDEDEEEQSEDEDEDEEEKAVEKGHDGEGTRKSRKENTKKGSLDFGEIYKRRTGGDS